MANSPILAFSEFYIWRIAQNYDAITALIDKMDEQWKRLSFVTSVQWTMNGILGCCALLMERFGIKHISCEREMLDTEDPYAVARNCFRVFRYVPCAPPRLAYQRPPWIKM